MAIISFAFVNESRPSGWNGGESSDGWVRRMCSRSRALSIITVASLHSTNDPPSMIRMASRTARRVRDTDQELRQRPDRSDRRVRSSSSHRQGDRHYGLPTDTVKGTDATLGPHAISITPRLPPVARTATANSST